MIKNRLFTALILFGVFCSPSAFAGPFGIDMSMSLAQIRAISKTPPEHLQDDIYEITPPRTNVLFEKYIVRIDPDYGVYWIKAIGKDIYTNSYGDDLKSEFNSLVETVRKTYGKETFHHDELREGSMWDKPSDFMYALYEEHRQLHALWSKALDLRSLLEELVNDTTDLEEQFEIARADLENSEIEGLSKDDVNVLLHGMFDLLSDTAAVNQMRNVLSETEDRPKIPNDISGIGIFAYALSTTVGYISLEYSFSNDTMVQEKADSVF